MKKTFSSIFVRLSMGFFNKCLQNYLIIIVLIPVIFIFNGCAKQGCTLPCATNYNSKAKEDDGSCKGCKNSYADNYCSGVKFSDASCECNGDGFLEIKSGYVGPGPSYDIYIDGGFYGKLYAGEKKIARVPVGTHDVHLYENISNPTDCIFSTVYIAECDIKVFECP